MILCRLLFSVYSAGDVGVSLDAPMSAGMILPSSHAQRGFRKMFLKAKIVLWT